MRQRTKTIVLMVSSSQFLLEGISPIIKVQKEDMEIITNTLEGRIEELIAQTSAQFVFIDNRPNEINTDELLDSIARSNPNIRFILFKDEEGLKEYDSSNITLITKETGSFELLRIMTDQGLDIMEGKVSDNLSCY